MLKDLIVKNRSYRKFDASEPVSRETLEELIDMARLCASGGNLQPLKYKLFCDPEENASVYSCLRWAGYLKDWAGPAENERPTAYIMLVRDNEITTNFIVDHGISAQTIMLGAVEKGLGGCIIGSIDRPRLRETFKLPMRYEILVVLALGKPVQTIELEEADGGDIHYWENDEGIHFVPKRPLSEVILD